MLFNLATIVDSLKVLFSKRKMKHFILGGITVLLGKQVASISVYYFNSIELEYTLYIFVYQVCAIVKRTIENKQNKRKT